MKPINRISESKNSGVKTKREVCEKPVRTHTFRTHTFRTHTCRSAPRPLVCVYTDEDGRRPGRIPGKGSHLLLQRQEQPEEQEQLEGQVMVPGSPQLSADLMVTTVSDVV